MNFKYFGRSVLAICVFSACHRNTSTASDAFAKKWYAGKAEISSFTLQQSRYGSIRKGDAVLIFVTEDFSGKKLVKLDDPDKTSEKLRVMKMNMTKSFITGIYPYSMMLSVFTPVSQDGDRPTLKDVCTSQEWCGQTYSQLTLKGNKYNWLLHSYFESEGEQDKSMETALLEDEMWNRIRLNPSKLPQGKANLLPGLLWQRLSHLPVKAEEAILTLSAADTFFLKNTGIQMYTIHYPADQRTLQIYFQQAFPYDILGWQDTYPDGFGNSKNSLTTKAVLKKKIWLDYWKHNTPADSTYRDSLQLMPHG